MSDASPKVMSDDRKEMKMSTRSIHRRSSRPAVRASLVAALCALGLAVSAPAASAEFGVQAFDGGVFDPGGAAYVQAGGHPDHASSAFLLNTEAFGEGPQAEGGPLRDVDVSLPPGLIGNPSASPQCPNTKQVVTAGNPFKPDQHCPTTSVVGQAYISTGAGESYPAPVYNVEPPPGAAAAFAFDIQGTITTIEATLRDDGDYGVDLSVDNASSTLRVIGTEVMLWGTPADPSHDAQRCASLLQAGIEFLYPPLCVQSPGAPGGPGPGALPEKAFITNPTVCTPAGEGLDTQIRVRSYTGAADEAGFESHLPPGYSIRDPQPPANWGAPQGPDGCEDVPFAPSVASELSTGAADSPTGLDFDISVPSAGLEDPGKVAQSHLKKAVVTLPEGVSVNPSSAAGLGSCSPAQLAAETATSASGEGCPQSSKIGSVRVDSPLLAVRNELGEAQRDGSGKLIPDPLTGSIYLAKQNDNPFNSLLALYIVVKKPERGIAIKLAGRVDTDPVTGRLVATFDNNPQLPFSNLHVAFNSGSRAPLVTPRECGTYSIESDLYPWARPDSPVHVSSAFAITSGPDGAPCPGAAQFAPAFEAGTLTPVAGTYSPLLVNASRPDGSQVLRGLNLDLPEGLVGKLAGIPYCPEPALAAVSGRSGRVELAFPSCSAASRIGTVDVAAGAGSTPFRVQGAAYLAGPYKGAPLSVAVITPAVAGPFDLGTVLVRARADVDPTTAQIHITSDPIPAILQGIPLKVRSAEVDADRSQFMLNPTDCDPTRFAGTLLGNSAALAVSDRFQVGACRALGFEPSLALKLSGGTKRSDNPRLRATLTMPAGEQANIERVSVALPHSEFLDQSNIRTVCTRVQFRADSCPKGSIYGRARAFTPLLDEPLEGPVYLRSSDNTLPDLVAALRGQIEIDLAGRIDSVNGGIRTTFSLVPDARVSKFVLLMQGGRKGLLENSRDICSSPGRATVKVDAQNGKVRDTRPVLKRVCPKNAE